MGDYKNIDEYIAEFPVEIQIRLESIRNTVREVAPAAVETISYQMPTFKMNGKNLIHFAAFKNHIGLYPLPDAIKYFEKDLENYKQGKGSIQFDNDKPLPLELIKNIIKFRLETFGL